MSPPRIDIDIDRFVRLTGLSIEAACTLLSSVRTRVGLYVLSRCESRLSLDRLVTAVIDVTAETSRSAARISLVHVTLPKLEDYGVLEYKIRSETVELSGPIVGLGDPLGTRSERSATDGSGTLSDSTR